MTVDTKTIIQYLEGTLSPKRMTHSLGVAEEAEKLAVHYGADVKKAYLAGLVHDCAKEVPPEEALRQMREEFGVMPDDVMVAMPQLLHGPLGALIAQKEFGITDAEMLDAVRYHTTGKAHMSLLEKIIYIADYIEPNRDYPDVDFLRALTYESLDDAILFGIDFTIHKLVETKKVIHPDTVHCRNDVLMQQK